MTFHPPGSERSASVLHHEPWLDFNWVQTATKLNFANYHFIERDYALKPPKPTLDSEVAYETSFSLRPEEPRDRRISPWDVRRGAYWAVFAGACGHTYGHRSFIGWMRRGETYRAGAHVPWYESLDAPGARQVVHLKRLIEAMPRAAGRVPDESLLASNPGRGSAHIRALRARDGGWALVLSATRE